MDRDIIEQLAEAIMQFVRKSELKFRQLGIRPKDLRVAMPEYLRELVSRCSYSISGEFITSINGIDTHPIWENAITVYCIHYPAMVFNKMPVFKMSFSEAHDEIGLTKRIVIDLEKIYRYKR